MEQQLTERPVSGPLRLRTQFNPRCSFLPLRTVRVFEGLGIMQEMARSWSQAPSMELSPVPTG